MTDESPCIRTRSAPRHRLPRSPAEFDDAWARMDLPVRLGPWLAGARDAPVLPDGATVTVHRAGPEAAGDAAELHRRCSPQSLRRRYPGPAPDADRYLPHLLDPRHGLTLAGWAPDGRLVALGHLLRDGQETEVALLVEDAWQGRGLGRELLLRLVARARDAGCDSVYAVTQPDNAAMAALMAQLGLPLEHHTERGTLVITAGLGGSDGQAPPEGV